ncbi:ABC-type transport auxiliary lipoprotein family protein [Marinobacter sp. X15-166B]|uniref:ABC-type transport auxiliary lipoprotein family protein n=1 Tax=Marinobacter sp. X15-166B TaxID=1897620 RepID=UPI00085CABEE|nr:ABC-type transport auxiliary lipoprotein family protein [Marinobacter sp. X15-166B]OEY67426.1 hypothetical protein BG841_13940 [Marinobacter sp. X15-166B]
MKPSISVTAAVIAGLMSLPGCTVLPRPDPPRVMDFPVPELPRQTDGAAPAMPVTLRVDTPHASEPFNGTGILAKPQPWEFRIYGGVRWRDNIPVIMRDLLAGVLRSSGSYHGVISDTNPATAQHSLITELSAFHTERPGLTAPDTTRQYDAVIELHAQLLDNRSRATLCARSFRATEPIRPEDTAVEAAVLALAAAGQALALELRDWLQACPHQP